MKTSIQNLFHPLILEVKCITCSIIDSQLKRNLPQQGSYLASLIHVWFIWYLDETLDVTLGLMLKGVNMGKQGENKRSLFIGGHILLFDSLAPIGQSHLAHWLNRQEVKTVSTYMLPGTVYDSTVLCHLHNKVSWPWISTSLGMGFVLLMGKDQAWNCVNYLIWIQLNQPLDKIIVPFNLCFRKQSNCL